MSDGGLPKPLAELTDRELEDEVQRRRRLRAASKKPEAPITEAERRALERFERGELGRAGSLGASASSAAMSSAATSSAATSAAATSSDMAAAVERADLVKHYAALELRPGATLAQVQSAYRELVAKYSPDKHAQNPDKHRAAVQLVAELTRAYQALADKLSKK